jgi:hypothetical protein
VPGNGGLDAQAMLAQPRKSYVLYGVEPPHDFADGAATLKALRSAPSRSWLSAPMPAPALREVADVILPIALAAGDRCHPGQCRWPGAGRQRRCQGTRSGASRLEGAARAWVVRCSWQVSNLMTLPAA